MFFNSFLATFKAQPNQTKHNLPVSFPENNNNNFPKNVFNPIKQNIIICSRIQTNDLFGLKRKGGEAEKSWPKINLFLINSTLLPSQFKRALKKLKVDIKKHTQKKEKRKD